MITEYLLDTETTGLVAKKHTIIEICIIKREDWKEVDRLYMKIKPTSLDIRDADPVGLKKNGYRTENWKDAEDPRVAARKIVDFIEPKKDTYLIAHNIGFDTRFIREFCKRYNQKVKLPYMTIDTAPLAKVFLWNNGLRSGKMDEIRKFLGWSKEGAHTAMQDTEDLVRLWDILRPRSIML